MRNLKPILLCGLLLAITACVAPKPAMTPLEIQSMQTRQYENDKNVVFASVMSVFQDLGYTIKSADKDTGLITGSSAAKSDTLGAFMSGVTSVEQTSATAFIEQIGSYTSVRLNFVVSTKKSAVYGQTNEFEKPILNAQIYQNAFERIENAIFVRSAK